MTDALGFIVNDYTYDSYGRIETSSEAVANPFTYTAREFDSESGLYYYRARYYEPDSGRFLSEDPIGFAGGDVNLYRYVRNSPINFRDPLGLETLPLGDPVGGTPLNVSMRELAFAMGGTIAPAAAFAGGVPCALGALFGASAAANAAIFRNFAAGAIEQFNRNNATDDCQDSDKGPILPADETFLDIAEAIGIGAASGCATGMTAGFAGATAGFGATTGAVIGFIEGLLGPPPVP